LEELPLLSLDEVIASLESYLDNFLLDAIAGMAYLNRLLRERNLGNRPDIFPWLGYLADKVASQAPFDPKHAEMAARLAPARWGRFAEYLSSLRVDDQPLHLWQAWFDSRLRNSKRNRLHQLLRRDPENPATAAQLLMLDYMEGEAPGDWIRTFRVPEKIVGLWQALLFRHHAALGMVQPALRLLTTWQEDVLGELDLALAAEVLYKTGELDRALVLLRKSLERDPRQGPVRRRLEEMLQPTSKPSDPLAGKSIGLCIPVCGEGEPLSVALAHLAECELGGTSIRILLNGAPASARDAAAAGRDLFPGREYIIEELPVYVGVAASRNWLIRRELNRGADMVAFIDEYSAPDADWLPWLAATMDAQSKPGAVGLKVLAAGKPARVWFLHRALSAARPGLLKLHAGAPLGVFMTGIYSYIRPVMGISRRCCLLSREALAAVPEYDVRLSTPKACAAGHDLELKLNGFDISYCGRVSCLGARPTADMPWGEMVEEGCCKVLEDDPCEALGDIVKLTCKFHKDMHQLRRLTGLFHED
jgi:tetratricopeptide (TPR) repeat protein